MFICESIALQTVNRFDERIIEGRKLIMYERASKKDSYLAIWMVFLFNFFIPLPFVGIAIGIYYFMNARNYVRVNLLLFLGITLLIEQLIIYGPVIIFLLITC